MTDAQRLIFREIHRGPLYIFSAEMLSKVRTLARDEPTVHLEEFSPPRQMPQFRSRVVGIARIKEGSK